MTETKRLNLERSKVMVVDDNRQSMDLLIQVLAGFRLRDIVQCGSAEEARPLVNTQSFDLMFIDDAMPVEDGIEFTRYIRSQPSLPNFTTPIIVVSGFTPEERVVRSRNAGANMVVAKPIAAATLIDRIAWIARATRAFVTSDSYNGPDRRSRRLPPPAETGERRVDAQTLIASPDRALSQNDIDSLFD